MRLVLSQANQGLPCDFARLMKATVASMNSSSTVSMRLMVSGPVSSQRCLPTRPNRGCSVGSSVSRCDALQHAARTVLLQEFRVLGIVELLRLLLFVQVIEVAVELVEAVHGRQAFVAIAEVVLAELSRGVTLGLQHLGQRRSRGLDSQRVAGQADRRHAAADRVLAGDECGATRGARWLRIVVGEHRAFAADAIDVRRGVAHHAGVVEAEVRPADVVPEDHQDVGPGSGSGISNGGIRDQREPDAINACNAVPIRDWNK